MQGLLQEWSRAGARLKRNGGVVVRVETQTQILVVAMTAESATNRDMTVVSIDGFTCSCLVLVLGWFSWVSHQTG